MLLIEPEGQVLREEASGEESGNSDDALHRRPLAVDHRQKVYSEFYV